MEEDRIEVLDEIGFSWDVVSDTWEENYADLCDFQARNGHILPLHVCKPMAFAKCNIKSSVLLYNLL